MLRSVASEFVSTGVQLGVDVNPYPTRNHVQIFATLIQTRKIVITNHVPFPVICTDIQFLKNFARVCDTIIYYYYILFCKGRTIPNKSLSLEIFIYLVF